MKEVRLEEEEGLDTRTLDPWMNREKVKETEDVGKKEERSEWKCETRRKETFL